MILDTILDFALDQGINQLIHQIISGVTDLFSSLINNTPPPFFCKRSLA